MSDRILIKECKARPRKALFIPPLVASTLLFALYVASEPSRSALHGAEPTKKVTVELGVETKTTSTTNSTPTLTVHQTKEQSVALTGAMTYQPWQWGNITTKGSWGVDRNGPKTSEVKSVSVGVKFSF